MDEKELIILNLLDLVEENSVVTQRSIATKLGVALGLTNTYLKRCTKKGLIKIQQIPSNRYAYYLTPRGFAEKSRLSAEYLKQSFDFFRHARQQSDELLQHCIKNGWTRIALVGKSDLTEIIILSATEKNIKLVGIIDSEAAETTSTFINLPVTSRLSELGTLHALIITSMYNPQDTFEEAIKFFPRDKVLTPQLLGIKKEKVAYEPIPSMEKPR